MGLNIERVNRLAACCTNCDNFKSVMPQVEISNRGAKRIRRGHLWVYRSDVLDHHQAEGGAIVHVVDEANNFVGQAFYSDGQRLLCGF